MTMELVNRCTNCNAPCERNCCLECNATKLRMHRLKNADAKLAEDWGLIDRRVVVTSLRALKKFSVTTSRRKCRNSSKRLSSRPWSGSSRLEEATLTKHISREKQKQNIYERSKRHECPIRRVTLYQGPSYSEFSLERTKEVEEHK